MTATSKLKKVRRGGMFVGGGAILAIGILLGMLGRVPKFGQQGPADAKTLDSIPTDVMGYAAGIADPVSVEQPAPVVEENCFEDGILTVLIDDRNYSVRITSGSDREYRDLPLDRLIDLARQAPGDPDGLRIRVLRRESARASAENQLHQALQDAGLAGAMDWQKPFVQ